MYFLIHKVVVLIMNAATAPQPYLLHALYCHNLLSLWITNREHFFWYQSFQTEGKRTKDYRYVAVSQEEIDEDSEVRVMCMKMMGKSEKVFKTSECEIYDITFEQVNSVLHQPAIKNVQ